VDTIQESIDYWRALAADERRRPSWDRYACSQACKARADAYERTARALEMERDSGVWHCSCCLMPKGSH
jgi:hypothetical protein